MRLLNIKIVEWCKKQKLEIIYSSCNTLLKNINCCNLLETIIRQIKSLVTGYRIRCRFNFLSINNRIKDVFLLRKQFI